MKTLFVILISLNCISQESWKFTQDKQLHFVAGYGIGLSSSMLTKDPKKGALLGFASTVFLAGAKELIFDKALGKGNPSFADFSYSVFGGCIGFSFNFIIKSK